jgi:hypothetical protein
MRRQVGLEAGEKSRVHLGGKYIWVESRVHLGGK